MPATRKQRPASRSPASGDDTTPLSQDDAIRAALRALVAKHPRLERLVAAVPASLRITPEFVSAYRKSRLSYGTRSLVLRVLLAEQVGGLPAEHARLSGAVLRRAVDWWNETGALAGISVARENTPKAFSTLLGVDRSSFPALISRMAIHPLVELRSHGATRFPAYAGLSLHDLEPLRDLEAARRLTTAAADRLMASRTQRAPSEYTWWFKTGNDALDLRNTLVYLARLFAGDRKGGRIQNLIPKPLSDRWNLKRLSVPDALAFCDVTSLAFDSVLKLDALSPRADWLEIGAPLRTLGLLLEGDGELSAAVAEHAARWRMSDAVATRRQQLLANRTRDGQFDSGFLFFTARLVSRSPEAPPSNLRRFAPYYKRLDPARLLASYLPAWREAGVDIEPQLAAWARTQRLPQGKLAMRLRDLGNALAYLAHLDIRDAKDAWRALPTVARWSLGEAMPVAGGRAMQPGNRPTNRAVAAPTRGERALPVLEVLWAATQVAVLSPTYRGVLPDATRIFVHAAHAAAFTVPEGVGVVGSAPVPWGSDPAELAAIELKERGHHVFVLG